MRMIPDQPYRTGSPAERRIFESLKRMTLSPETVGFHSLNLTRHEFKRFGELDFVILGPEGLLALEVKGGQVVRDEKRVWHYTNRFGETESSLEGPFRQVEHGLHALCRNLENEFGVKSLKNLVQGFGVAFPQCPAMTRSAEWDPMTLADEVDCRQFGDWLKRLIRYWHQKHPGARDRLPRDLLVQIQDYLRPRFEAIVPLHIQAARVEEAVVQMTRDQLRLVDVAAANPRVVCEGGAGTGKTFLALELARRWTADGAQVMFVCKSPWLQRFLETRLLMPNLVLATVDALPIKAKREGIELFDRMIVDEGQDLLQVDDLHLLDRYQKGGLEQGRWSFFQDSNHQAGLFGPVDPRARDLIQAGHPTLVPLKTNCRNTLNILSKVKEVTRADMGAVGAGTGPDVRFLYSGPEMPPEMLLEKELERLVIQEGVPPGMVTILSPNSFQASCVSRLEPDLVSRISVLDEFSMREFPPPQISYATIASFKGLENRCVILVDLENPKGKHWNATLLYVGMSRARAWLCLIGEHKSLGPMSGS